jgi:hypothetical protein
MEDELVKIAEVEMPPLSDPLPEDLRLRATRSTAFSEGGWTDAAQRVQERCLHLVQHADAEEGRPAGV